MIVHLKAKHMLRNHFVWFGTREDRKCWSSHRKVDSTPVERCRVLAAVEPSPTTVTTVTMVTTTRLRGLRFQAELHRGITQGVRAELTVN